ncbi:MAG: NADPH-dependent FMN reductase [Tunicatimonas sp.]
MTTILVGTNRTEAVSRQVAEYYQGLLTRRNVPNQILDLHQLPADFLTTALYERSGQNDAVNLLSAMIAESNKLVLVVPEYNGSYPGILKTFIDGLAYPSPMRGKKCALVGLSSGTQGGSIALSHLTDVLNYLGAHVLALKPKLALIEKYFDGESFSHRIYQEILDDQVDQLIAF